MCYGMGCSREWECGGTCRDPRKCIQDAEEYSRDEAWADLAQLNENTMKGLRQIRYDAEVVIRGTLSDEARDLAEEVMDKVEAFMDEFLHGLKAAREAVNA